MTHTPTARTWLVTGASRGIGRAIAVAALRRGDRVVAAVRDPGALGELAREHPGAQRTVALDVRDAGRVHDAVEEAARCWGGLDVVVNNAGLGMVGTVEEVSDDEAVDHLQTNLLGPLRVCRAALPHLRERGGDVVQISTVGAVGAMPALGLYNAGKWGLEGFSEALAGEVAALGVHVTIAELGGFATDWAGASMRFATPLPAYDELRLGLFGTAEVPWPTAGEAGGADPAVAAEAILEHLDRDPAERPLRLLVGDDAPEQAAAALERRRADYAGDPRLRWPTA